MIIESYLLLLDRIKNPVISFPYESEIRVPDSGNEGQKMTRRGHLERERERERKRRRVGVKGGERRKRRSEIRVRGQEWEKC